MLKKRLRNKILKIRETYNKDNIKLDYKRIINFFKKKNIIAKKIGGYFPINFEFDDLDLLKKFEKDNYQISLPVIKKSFQMDFYNWTFFDPLKINNLGIPEPEAKKLVHPDILFIPMVAFDKNLNRLGYGGGYYDRFIEKLSRKKNIIKIGLALSCQKIKKIPINKHDQKLDFIITNEDIIK